MPISPTSNPPAASTTIQRPSCGDAGSASAIDASATARDAEAPAVITAARASARSGTSAERTTPAAAVASTAIASHSRLATKAPEGRRVAGAELGEDPLVKDARDDGEQQQVDRDPDLDRK